MKNDLHFKEKDSKRYIHNVPLENSMATQLDNDSFHFDGELFHHKLPQQYRKILNGLARNFRHYILFNLAYLSAFTIEMILFLTFISKSNDSIFLAINLGTIFLTIFSYLVLLFYYQARKTDQLNDHVQQFLTSCRENINLPSGVALYHLSVAEALLKLSQHLFDYAWNLFRLPDFLGYFSRPITRASERYHWRDIIYFRQLLLQASIEEHLKQIRSTPTDLEVHASLANTYVILSQIYKEPKESTHPRHNFYKKHAILFEEKIKIATKLAIEEFQILNQYAPNDPWIHEQLAIGYHNLGLYQEEIEEMEILLKLRPQDREILFRLGTLYFQQNNNSKGLQVYEELKKTNFKKAEDLISSYGSGHFHPISY